MYVIVDILGTKWRIAISGATATDGLFFVPGYVETKKHNIVVEMGWKSSTVGGWEINVFLASYAVVYISWKLGV